MDEGAVLDASALIALLADEPGADVVAGALEGSAISAVNLTEVAETAVRLGGTAGDLRQEAEALGIEVAPFTPDHAVTAAQLRPRTSAAGLSLADRACLALALELAAPALTADRAWNELDVGVEVRLIR